MNQKIIISDPTLRDGNHAVKHTLSQDAMRAYARAIDQVGVDIVEVGHGNGLGASSFQVGRAASSDEDMLRAVREELVNTKLGIHIIPGFGRIDKELKLALDVGVDVFRVASHCTEADTTQRHISHLREKESEVFGVLMMSHMATAQQLLDQAKKMLSYGAEAVILMDSAGCFLPSDVKEKVGYLVRELDVPVGFHAHNNLSMAVANSVMAVEVGATLLDATAAGFGAGAGNTPLEVLVSVLKKIGYSINIDTYKLLDAVELAKSQFITELPHISSLSLVSGIYGVFSGFAKPVKLAAEQFGVDPREIFRLLGERQVVAGQEDLIIEIAQELKEKRGEINA